MIYATELYIGKALGAIAQLWASTNPGDAVKVAREIDYQYWKAKALAEIAQQLAKTNPDKAYEIFEEAVQVAREIDIIEVKTHQT